MPPWKYGVYAWHLSPDHVEIVSHVVSPTTFEAAGTWFLTYLMNRKDMLGQGLSLLKTLIKSSLDNYVLPGTLSGTEILLLYMRQWKRDVVLLTCATRELMSPQASNSEFEVMSGDSENKSASAE